MNFYKYKIKSKYWVIYSKKKINIKLKKIFYILSGDVIVKDFEFLSLIKYKDSCKMLLLLDKLYILIILEISLIIPPY